MMEKASNTDWNRLLADLDNPKAAYDKLKKSNRKIKNIFYKRHMENLRLMSTSKDGFFPKASDLYNALIMPAYNESIEVIEPALKSVVDTTYDKKHLIIVFAYEERGGAGIEETAKTLRDKYGKYFHSFHIVKHPKDLPNEVIGKGGNITYAGKWLKKYLEEQKIAFSNVIVTTMDCDNKPHKYYFDYPPSRRPPRPPPEAGSSTPPSSRSATATTRSPRAARSAMSRSSTATPPTSPRSTTTTRSPCRPSPTRTP